MNDPFVLLGIDRSASLSEIRAARRRLAFEAHPDRGGDEQRMREINAAFDAAIGHITGRRVLDKPVESSRSGGSRSDTESPTRSSSFGRGSGPWPTGSSQRARRRISGGRPNVQHDAPSFVIEALPAEAFEALLIVASWIGEPLVDEPPYLLEVQLTEPGSCWCRLDLVPDAGSSTVSITVVGDDGELPPDVETVRDVWVAQLNTLGRLDPGEDVTRH